MLKKFKHILSLKRSKQNDLTYQEKYSIFKKLIAANDEAHKAMSEMGEMIILAEPFTRNQAEQVFRSLISNSEIILESLNLLSHGKYKILQQKLKTIVNDSKKILNPRFLCPEGWDCPDYECHACPKIKEHENQMPYFYDLAQIDKSYYLEVGGKMSRLGEMKNILKLNVPDGFCLTIRLFEEFMSENNLWEKIDKILQKVDFTSIANIREIARESQNVIIANQMPKFIEEKIIEIFNHKFGYDQNIRIAVRSSALGEDGDRFSFAGLHHSELNVSRENLIDACFEVMISKYSPESLVYRFINGLRDQDMPMSIGCMMMVNAETAGVLFTKDPNGEKNGVIIQAVRGLGLTVVEGKVSPQEFIVGHSEDADILNFSSGRQYYMDVANDKSGISKKTLDPNLSVIPSLSNDQVKQLIKCALLIEEHFGGPQDIEWAYNKSGKLYILQARPLKITYQSKKTDIEIDFDELKKDNKLLIESGNCASHGIASGKVRVIDSPRDFIGFPMGGIIVSKKNIPEFASLIHKASGVITDFGSTSGHLSIIAREMGVPILTNTETATQILKNDMLITMDADQACVFEGMVDKLIEFKKLQIQQHNNFISSPLFKIWHRLSKFVFKLNLFNPDSPKFKADNCQTLHDIIRFSHETSIRLMFSMFTMSGDNAGKSYLLKFGVPLDLHLINLDNGLKVVSRKNWITTDSIGSVPFLALIKGMKTPGIKWAGHLPIDFKGYARVIFGNLIDVNRNESEIGSKSYAIVSKNYFNFFSRLGYHFTRIDVFAHDEINANYINFYFRGGAADEIRKSRRVRAIKLILDHYDFISETKDDSVIARIRKVPLQKILELVEMLGKLMGSVRNTDVTMLTEKHIDIFVKSFIEGDPAPALKLINE